MSLFQGDVIIRSSIELAVEDIEKALSREAKLLARAGIIPSVCESNLKPSNASLSETAAYLAQPIFL